MRRGLICAAVLSLGACGSTSGTNPWERFPRAGAIDDLIPRSGELHLDDPRLFETPAQRAGRACGYWRDVQAGRETQPAHITSRAVWLETAKMECESARALALAPPAPTIEVSVPSRGLTCMRLGKDMVTCD